MIECSRIVGLPDMDRRRCEPICQGRIKIVTTDLFTELVPLIESARILATLYQRPYTQGKLAFETLCRYLIQNIQPEPITRVAPHIVLRSNLPLFIDRLPGSLESTTTA
jgi:LacI family transcriptional regulator